MYKGDEPMTQHSAVKALVAALVLALLSSPARAADALSPDGKVMAVSEGATIHLKDAATGKDIAAIRAHTGAVNALAFSPDGRRLASGGQDNAVCIFEAATGKVLLRLQGHQAAVNSVKFSADGKTLTTTDFNQKTHTWDLATGKQVQ
jgi:WD40 repeat protein